MDERDHETEEESVRDLLEKAGPRPPIPQEDLDAISRAARSAWQAELRHRGAGVAAETPLRRRPLRALVLGLAAALALAVGLAGWWRLRSVPPPPAVAWVEMVAGPIYLEAGGGGARGAARPVAAGAPIPRGAVLRSGDSAEGAGRAALRLAGGVSVRLDAATRLRLVSAGALELERGALYVDTGSASGSASGAARAGATIEVRTPLGTAQDVGTQFTVRLLGTAGSTLLVRVRDGAVRTEQSGQTFLTAAGQELILHRDGMAESHAAAPHGPEWQWVLATSARFAIEGRTLEEFLAWSSRETGWRIVFADEELARSARTIVLHGGIGDLRPDRAPFAVLPGAGLEGELADGRLLIRRRR
jgi:hypothetical protein